VEAVGFGAGGNYIVQYCVVAIMALRWGGISFLLILYAGYMVRNKTIFGNTVLGCPSLMTAILFLGGVQLIGVDILGGYVGRIYMKAKHRPRYMASEIVRKNNAQAVSTIMSGMK